MAMISMTFDTMTKEMKVSIDGEPIDACCIRCYSEKYISENGEKIQNYITIEKRPEQKDGMTECEQIVAANSINNLEKSYASADKSLVKVKNMEKISKAFASWLCN